MDNIKQYFSAIVLWFQSWKTWVSDKAMLAGFLFRIFRGSTKAWRAIKDLPESLTPESIKLWLVQWVLPLVDIWVEYAKTTSAKWDDYMFQAIRELIVGDLWGGVTVPAIRDREIIPTP